MSRSPTSRSPDVALLGEEGYAVEIRAGHILVHDVPYVDSSRQARRGTLVSTLTLRPDGTTAAPDSHVALFIGDTPCDRHGQPLNAVIGSTDQRLAEDLTINHTLSAKRRGPAGHENYVDYHDKMSSYVWLLASQAAAVDTDATPLTFRTLFDREDDSPFVYPDTSSTRARIAAVAAKLRLCRVAIVGLGGTGAYILDLVAKTPVQEIHLYDGDRFVLHNAFRSPGAPTTEALTMAPYKTAYLAQLYSAMHRGIESHSYRLDAENANELAGFDFVFLAVDDGEAKKPIVAALEDADVPFIDVGMGLHLTDDAIGGQVRVTTSTPEQRDHLHRRVPLAGADIANQYTTNIQIADLNALNAALAVIRWKKWCGFYLDFDREHHSTYVIDGNQIINDDQAP